MRLNKEEAQKELEKANQEEFEFVFEDEGAVKSQKIHDILDALDLVDPVNKKVTNTLPGGDLPGSEFNTVEWITLYEPTISGEDRKKLIRKLMSLLTEDDTV